MSDDTLVECARHFAQSRIRPNAARLAAEAHFPRDLHLEAGGLGLNLLLLSEDAGGPGADPVAAGVVAEEFAAAGTLTPGLALFAHNYVAWAIAGTGDRALMERYLPAMLAGERIGIFCLTEPAAGSDAAAIQCHASQLGGEWFITGEKAWISHADEADFFIVFAQTEAGSGPKGIALFLVEGDTPGIDRLERYDMLGGNPVGMGGLRFTQTQAERMLVEPGQGLRTALSAIDWARSYVAAMACGMLRQSLDEAIAYAASRAMFGRTTAEMQAVQFVLAEAATDLAAAKHLAFGALRNLAQRHPDASVMAAHAKKFATRQALIRISECMQLMGANGMKHEHSLARHMVGAKMAQYLDGATEVQNVVIARSLLAPYGIRSS